MGNCSVPDLALKQPSRGSAARCSPPRSSVAASPRRLRASPIWWSWCESNSPNAVSTRGLDSPGNAPHRRGGQWRRATVTTIGSAASCPPQTTASAECLSRFPLRNVATQENRFSGQRPGIHQNRNEPSLADVTSDVPSGENERPATESPGPPSRLVTCRLESTSRRRSSPRSLPVASVRLSAENTA